jgi:hypothetical protein
VKTLSTGAGVAATKTAHSNTTSIMNFILLSPEWMSFSIST